MFTRAAQVRIGCLCLLLAFSGCSNHPKAPVKSLSSVKPSEAAVAYNQYRVQKGDTLYSIAFRYGLNYQNLARNNNIAPPYRISPGQMIELNGDFIPFQEVIKPQREVTRTQTEPESKPGKKPVTKKPAQPANKKPTTGANKKPVVASQYDNRRTVKGWTWPIKTSRTYSRSAENQFLFKVPQGTDVHAAAAGRVVYSGTGLVGYGHLIIIKHSDSLLSAYAFNDKVLVKEKQEIRAGQKISTVGKSPTGDIGLGFEIRQRGTPIDARRYLPK